MVGAVVGALLHLGTRIVGILRLGFPLRPRLAVRTGAFREFVRLMLPKMASTPIEPIQFQVFNYLATGLAAGSVGALSFAKDFQGAPVNVIGSRSRSPSSRSCRWPRPRATARRSPRVVRRNLATVAGLSAVAAVLLVLLGPVFVAFFRGGAFDAEDERVTLLAPGSVRAVGAARIRSSTRCRAASTRPATRCSRCSPRSPGWRSR